MAVIYLKHETFGAKVACSEHEAAYDETHGWVRYTPGALIDPIETPNSMIPRRKRTQTVAEGTTWPQPEN
jgi:hypothetical protein